MGDFVPPPPLRRDLPPSQGATGHGHLSTARQGTEAAEEPSAAQSMCQARNYTQIPFVWHKERRQSRLLRGCPPPSGGSADPEAAVASFKGHGFPPQHPRKATLPNKVGLG